LTNVEGSGSRRKTSLQQVLEDSRAHKLKKPAQEVKSVKEVEKAATKSTMLADGGIEDDWEDEEGNPDVTVDLNEPHSKSGKYWKSEFGKYTEDARAEMERLVKYKHLAKRYAEKKDAETVELNQKLEAECEKVAKLERKITKMTVHLADKQKPGGEADDPAFVKDLADKAALAIRYRDRAKELERLLKEHNELDARKPSRHRKDTSPQTEQKLLDLERELGKVRSQLKRKEGLQDEVDRLNSDLLFAQQRATKLAEENRLLAGESTQISVVQKLESLLRESDDQLRRKDAKLKELKKDYSTLKENAKRQRSQALQVLREKTDKIAMLEKDIREMKRRERSSERHKSLEAAISKHEKITRDLQTDVASMSRPSIHSKAIQNKTNPPLLRRAASAQDLTTDFTQGSLFEGSLKSPQKESLPNRLFNADWSADLLDLEEELKRDKAESMHVRKRDVETFDETLNFSPSKHIQGSNTPKSIRASSWPRKATTDILSDRANDASNKGPVQKDTEGRDATHGVKSQRDDKIDVDHLFDDASARRKSPRVRHGRSVSRTTDTPGFDLIQDRFARLGGPDITNTLLMANTSRCTLPADRAAAAKARIEQRRRDRLQAATLGYDKENIKP
jgi:DNA repair exonuclease SbcCD ATPase subunit